MGKNLLRKVLWFSKRIKYEIDFFDILQPQRAVREDSRYKSGVFFSAKCNRNIQYESGLELNFIKQLEQSDEVTFYWEQPCSVTYTRGKIRDKYTPDFALYLKSKEIVIVEIKTLPDMLDHRVQTKMEGLIKFCSMKGFGLLLTDGKDTIDKIRKYKYNRNLEKAILNAVADNRILYKNECKEIIRKCNATQNELLRIIAKNKLKYRSFTSKLEKLNKNKIFCHVFFDKRPYEDLITANFSILFNK